MMTNEERIAAYHAERDKALEEIRKIDQGMRLFQAIGMRRWGFLRNMVEITWDPHSKPVHHC
jgi:hypothetical protein